MKNIKKSFYLLLTYLSVFSMDKPKILHLLPPLNTYETLRHYSGDELIKASLLSTGLLGLGLGAIAAFAFNKQPLSLSTVKNFVNKLSTKEKILGYVMIGATYSLPQLWNF